MSVGVLGISVHGEQTRPPWPMLGLGQHACIHTLRSHLPHSTCWAWACRTSAWPNWTHWSCCTTPRLPGMNLSVGEGESGEEQDTRMKRMRWRGCDRKVWVI